MKKKVLITHASAGMGHTTAARAVVNAFKAQPDIEVLGVDVLEHTSKLWEKILRDGYNYVSSQKPGLWSWFYSHYNRNQNQDTLNFFARIAVKKSFRKVIEEFDPDFMVSTHPLPYKVYKGNAKIMQSNRQASVITDIGLHKYWVHPGVDYYFVAANELIPQLEENGVQKDNIIVSGIPIEEKFSTPVDQEKVRASLRANKDQPIVMIVGGQFSFEEMENVITEINDRHPEAKIVVVAGRDKELQQAIQRSDIGKREQIVTFGFVDNMHELMTVANLMFSKAGGLTVSESLAKGVPLVINKVIPGQEEDNVEFLVGHQAAVRVDDVTKVAAAINELLDDPAHLAQMQENARALGKPHAAQTIVDFVLKKLQ